MRSSHGWRAAALGVWLLAACRGAPVPATPVPIASPAGITDSSWVRVVLAPTAGETIAWWQDTLRTPEDTMVSLQGRRFPPTRDHEARPIVATVITSRIGTQHFVNGEPFLAALAERCARTPTRPSLTLESFLAWRTMTGFLPNARVILDPTNAEWETVRRVLVRPARFAEVRPPAMQRAGERIRLRFYAVEPRGLIRYDIVERGACDIAMSSAVRSRLLTSPMS